MTSGSSFHHDNPLVVQWEYASEERLKTRNEAYRRLIEGENAEAFAYDAVAESAPARVLDVGCGTGEFAERVAKEPGAEISAVDISARMVDLTRERGLDARVADVQHLPFEDESFDSAVANWVLYHVPDLDRGVRELHRVLRPGGHLVAATVGRDHTAELWQLVGGEPTSGLTFGPDNGEEVLRRVFRTVERRDAEGTLVFPGPAVDARVRRRDDHARAPRGERARLRRAVPDAERARRVRGGEVTAPLVDQSERMVGGRQLPPLDGPLRVRRLPVIFVAKK